MKAILKGIQGMREKNMEIEKTALQGGRYQISSCCIQVSESPNDYNMLSQARQREGRQAKNYLRLLEKGRRREK